MDYVATLRFRGAIASADRDAALVRRANWQYPKGIKVIAEYWPSGAETQVVSIFSTEDYAAIMELVFEWNDAFDVDVHPAISAEEGLKIGPQVFERLKRLQG